MEFNFSYEDVQSLCGDLMDLCESMKVSVREFENALGTHGEKIDDRITDAVTDVFKRIQGEINDISAYLKKYTGNKQDAARDMKEIQKSIANEVNSYGG